MVDGELGLPEAVPETTHRVIRLGESLRREMQARRRATGQTVRGFVAEAVEFEAPALVASLKELGITADAAGPGRLARLPLATDHARALRAAAAATGLPASLLLRAAIGRLARRKRRRAAVAAESASGEGCPSGKPGGPGRAGRRPRRAADPAGPGPSPTPPGRRLPAEGDAEASAPGQVQAADDPPRPEDC